MDLIIFPSTIGVLCGVQYVAMPRKISFIELMVIGTVVSTTVAMVIK